MKNPGTSLLINQIQLLLAEKRTSLATLRTGIAVFTKYVCPFCKYEFLERDIPRESKDSGDNE